MKDALQDDGRVPLTGTGASSSGTNRRRSGGGAGKTLDVAEKETPEMKAKKVLIEATKVAVNSARATNRKIENDLKEVDIVVNRLKNKKWDTTGPRTFLLSEAAKIKDQNDQLWELYMKHKDVTTEATAKGMSDDALTVVKQECDKAATAKQELWKALAKTTLSEFTRMK